MPDSSRHRRLAALLFPLLLGGCATLGYYGQAISGHVDLLARSRPVDTVIRDPATPPDLRARLEQVKAVREFAVRELGLPDNDSYRRYADLGRPYAVWNVFATPALSLEPRQWCFLIVGCVTYRGYFRREAAEREAAAHARRGDDVYVGGVAAYSTLGSTDDPILNTMLRRGVTETAAVVFHELAHQRVYVRGDTAFNESFAVTVEEEGVRRWLARPGQEAERERVHTDRERRAAFTALLLRYREKLDRLYRSDLPDGDKRAGKRRLFDALHADYAALKKGWNGDDRYDRWMATDLNNAKLAAVGTYHRYTKAFRLMLARRDNNLEKFYEDVRLLAGLSRAERETRLNALLVLAQ
jgi:predicted aminopeptidase